MYVVERNIGSVGSITGVSGEGSEKDPSGCVYIKSVIGPFVIRQDRETGKLRLDAN